MVGNETLNVTAASINDLVSYIGDIGLWIQAAGLFILLWLTFQTISLIWNWKKRQTLSHIKEDIKSLKKDIKRIEKKMDVIVTKKNERKNI